MSIRVNYSQILVGCIFRLFDFLGLIFAAGHDRDACQLRQLDIDGLLALWADKLEDASLRRAIGFHHKVALGATDADNRFDSGCHN